MNPSTKASPGGGDGPGDARAAPAIKVQGLEKAFGRARVLRGLDMEVAWGEVLTIFGPNGSGKTTLIKLLATLARPDSGRVLIGGLRHDRDGERIRRIIGVVTHNTLLYDDLTADENLRFYGRMFGLDEVGGCIQRVASQMGLISSLGQRVRTLSHGMQKRLSIARALLHDPAILLLDEPESGLDQEAQEMLRQVLHGGGTSSRTVVMTTHNLEQGLTMGHRVAIMAGGKLAYEEASSALDIASFRGTYFRYTGATL